MCDSFDWNYLPHIRGTVSKSIKIQRKMKSKRRNKITKMFTEENCCECWEIETEPLKMWAM